MAERFLLAADVGGTRTSLALARAERPWPRILEQASYASGEFAALEPIVESFLARPAVAPHRGAIEAACFSVAGPVAHNRTTLTNLGWEIRADALAAALGLRQVWLINDFAAAGYGLARLSAGELDALQPGQPVAQGVRLVIGAGTGLGVSLLTWEGERYVAHPSEAGHMDFAPVDELQDRLLGYLRRQFGRVSYERVVSGPGLLRIFAFLQESGAGEPSRALQEAARQHPDMAEVIGEFGVRRLDALAVRALDLFCAVYGAFAGNLALATLARGGVYIAGGIAPKIAPHMREGGFLRAFTSKGRFSELLATIPVLIVLDPRVGLYGALGEAQRLCGGEAAAG